MNLFDTLIYVLLFFLFNNKYLHLLINIITILLNDFFFELYQDFYPQNLNHIFEFEFF
jgi:hypothetical protein